MDDSAEFRALIRSALSTKIDVQLTAEASSGLDAIRKADRLNPELILLNTELSKLDGIKTARIIRDRISDTRILFISDECESNTVAMAIEAGAVGFVDKQRAQSDVLPAVEATLEGKQFFSSTLKIQVYDIFSKEDGFVWVDTVVGFSNARERLEVIANVKPGHYSLFVRSDPSIPVQANAARALEERLKQ